MAVGKGSSPRGTAHPQSKRYDFHFQVLPLLLPGKRTLKLKLTLEMR